MQVEKFVCKKMYYNCVNIRNWLKERRYFRNILSVAGGIAGSQLILLLAAPVITRLYTPEHYGYFAVYVSLFSILLIISSLMLEVPITIVHTERHAVALFVSALLALGVCSILAGVGVILYRSWVWNRPGQASLTFILLFLPISLLGGGVYKILTYYALRRLAFRELAVTRIQQSAVSAVLQIGLGFGHLGILGLALAHLVSRFSGCFTLWKGVRKAVVEALPALQFSAIQRTVCHYRHYPLIAAPAGLINSIGIEVPALLLASLYGAEYAGYFALAKQIMGQPLNLLGQSVGQAYTANAASYLRNDPLKLHLFFLRNSWHLAAVGAGVVVPTILFVHPVLRVVFGLTWENAGTVIQLLSLMFIAQFVALPLSQTLNLLERQGLQFVWNCGRLVAVVAALVVPHWLGFNWKSALLAYSLASAAAYVAVWILSWQSIQKHVRDLPTTRLFGSASEFRKGSGFPTGGESLP